MDLHPDGDNKHSCRYLCWQELFFIMAGTLNVALSFNSDGDTRLSRPGDQQATTKSFSYGPGVYIHLDSCVL